MNRILICFVPILLLSCTITQTDMNYKQDAFIEIFDNKILEILDPEAPFEILSTGHAWTEGPLWLEETQTLIFTDIPNNAIYQIKDGNSSIYLKPSGYTGEIPRGGEVGANGLTLDPQGRLVMCQHGDRRMARMDAPLDKPAPKFVTLVDNFGGKKLNSPNDVVFDKAGNMYFTDPPYGLEFNMDDPSKELKYQGVFCLKTNGDLDRIDVLSRPNGLAFSPDEKFFYVSNSDPKQAKWFRYEVKADGIIQGRTEFLDVTGFVGKDDYKGLPDGMKVHSSGIIFATGPGGVWVIDPDGKPLARIATGEATSNCAFSTDEKTFFMTADSYVLKLGLK